VIDSKLLKILCCPETHQELRLADSALIERMNQQITAGALCSRVGKPVSKKIDGGLVRADGKFLYPIRDDIPIMLVDEAIPLMS
jgi:uncharacterized protein YbaR (Trm112 family)